MNPSRDRLRAHFGPPALALVFALVGCSSGDGDSQATVPSPAPEVTELCRNLDEALPSTVDDQDRRDPSPGSALTAGWGNPAIILRCGVSRPAAMDDPEADGVEVNGVGWLLEEQDDGSFLFTSTLREAYVEVRIPAERAGNGMAPLVDLAPAVKKAVPEGIAD